MGRIIIWLFMVVSVYAGQILNVSYFPSSDRIDVLFSLDTPFKGKILKIKNNDYQVTGITFNRIEQKKFDNGLNIIISSFDDNSIELKLVTSQKLLIKASVTAKGYGLRLRILGVKNIQTKQDLIMKNLNTSNTSQPPAFNFVNYILIISVLIILIIVLLIIKKRALQKLPKSLQNDGYKMLYQKMIDPKNRIVLIEIFEKRYLLLLGDKNNLLLDDFSQAHQEELKDVSTQHEFNHLLEESYKNNAEAENFMSKASKLKELDGI